jgi:hypothetical protein
MCSPHLLAAFVMLCNHYFVNNPSNPNDAYALTKVNCVRAYDVCVERRVQEKIKTSVQQRELKELEQDALGECDMDFNTMHVFSEYYSGAECGYSIFN